VGDRSLTPGKIRQEAETRLTHSGIAVWTDEQLQGNPDGAVLRLRVDAYELSGQPGRCGYDVHNSQLVSGDRTLWMAAGASGSSTCSSVSHAVLQILDHHLASLSSAWEATHPGA